MNGISTTATAYRYIIRQPGVRSGHAIVEGTRIGVQDVVGLLQNGETVDAIAGRCFPNLTRAQVYECLAYYEDHRGGDRPVGGPPDGRARRVKFLLDHDVRAFYVTWNERVLEFPRRLRGNPDSEIFQTPSEKSGTTQIGQTPSDQLPISAGPSRKSPFTLSWSHYVELLTVKDPDERSFYEIEATNEGWSLPELRRQKAASLYERLALSRDKDGIKRLAREGQIVTRPEDLFKEPLVLEFLGLEEQARYSESDLESAIISQLQKFLLELGKGFLFEARQKRFTFDGDHYFLDLVFYNRLLRCYVVIDLKLDKLTHQDLGQMQMYVNYYDRHVKLPEENATIGLLLCREKNNAVVELTLPKDANIHAKEYQLYLPSKELLKAKLLEWAREEEAKA